tara:strand:+ start:1081 stop:3738 length:2658 start_codon:yes stop_codon:yes gene_type:complete
MAAVEEYRRNVQLRPANQQEVRVGTSANTFGGAVGAAAQDAGNAAFKIADAVDFKQQLESDASAREAFNAYRYEQREALRAPETGFLNQTGGNASGVQQTAEDRLDALRTQYGDGLDPRARQKYDALVDEMQDQAHASLLSYTSGESRNYIVNQRQATIDGFVEEAATNWNDEALFEQNLGLALREQSELGALQGWDGETAARAGEGLISSAYRNRIVMAASEDPIAAQQLLEQARDALSAEDEYALDTGLEGLVQDAQAEQFTQQFVVRGSAPRGTGSSVISAGSGYTVVRNSDGSVVRRDGTRAWRNNNPGNIEYGDFARSRGAVGTDGRFAVFSTYEEGRAAKASLLFESPSYRDRTIEGAIARYAPAFENDTGSYTAQVAAAAGVPPSTKMSSLNAAQREAMLDAMERVEGFRVGSERVVQEGSMPLPSGATGPETLTGRMNYDGVSAMIESAGQDNTEVNRQLYGRLGPSASSLIMSAQMTPALPASVALSPEVLAANPRFAGMSVGEVYDSVAAAVGDDPASRMGRNYFDVQGAYEAAMGIEDPEVRAKVLANIGTMATLQDRARTEGRREAAEEAWNEYNTNGTTDFPLEMRQRMGQAGWTSFQAAVRADQQGGTVTDPDTWETLTRLSSSDPRAFADLNLTSYYGSLSQSDRQRFILLQEDARAGVRGAAADREEGRVAMDFGKAYDAADNVYQALVEPTSVSQMNGEQRQRRLRFQQQLTDMMQDFYDRESREPNEREIREMATVLALPITYSKPNTGFWRGGMDGVSGGAAGSLFDAAMRATGTEFDVNVSYDDIPLADRTRIAAQLMQVSGGELPSPNDIVEAYEQQAMISAGLPPNVDIGGVPQWLIEIEKADNPSVTDDEIVEKYQLFLMSQ